MSNITLTEDQIETASALGMTPEAYAAVLAETTLQKGTYKFLIAGGDVKINNKPGDKKDAIQPNLRFQVLDSNGVPAKRYGSTFVRFTLPVPNGSYVPDSQALSQGIKMLPWLAAAAGMKQSELVAAFKNQEVPMSLLNATINGLYSTTPDKNDPSTIWKNVNPADKTAKVMAVSPDTNGASAGGASAGATASF